MRHEIEYRCTLTYDGAAAESHNELRAVPLTDERQTTLHARVQTTPGARVLTTTDYWGTRVDSFGIRAPHERLEIVVEATVDASPPPVVKRTVPTAALADPRFRDEHRELLDESPMAVGDDAVTALAEEVAERVEVDDVVALADACCATVAARVESAIGATEIGASPGDVLDGGAGACQDRSHLLVAVARQQGIPARYVSGYVTDRETCDHGTTHAWVEVAVPGAGWHTLVTCVDGTPRDERVVIGRGRDYGDVAPVRGSYIGGETLSQEVDVVVSRVVPVS